MWRSFRSRNRSLLSRWNAHWMFRHSFLPKPIQFIIDIPKSTFRSFFFCPQHRFWFSSGDEIHLRYDGTEPVFRSKRKAFYFYLVLPSFTYCYLVLPSFTWLQWALPSFTGFYWFLLGFTGFLRRNGGRTGRRASGPWPRWRWRRWRGGWRRCSWFWPRCACEATSRTAATDWTAAANRRGRPKPPKAPPPKPETPPPPSTTKGRPRRRPGGAGWRRPRRTTPRTRRAAGAAAPTPENSPAPPDSRARSPTACCPTSVATLDAHKTNQIVTTTTPTTTKTATRSSKTL